MKGVIIVAATCAIGARAFITPVVQTSTGCVTHCGRPQSSIRELRMGGASGVASTREGKARVLDEVTELLQKSAMVFSLPSSGIKANDVVRLRHGLPDGCTARVVKNKLMRRACQGSAFEGLLDITTGENFWLFIEGEDNLAAPIKYVKEFADTMDKDNAKWTQPIKGGVFAGDTLDADGVIAISKLPTKQELIQRLAVALNSVPTRLGRSIKLVPTKVGRAIKLAFADEDAAGADGAGEEAAAGGAEAEAAAPSAEASTPPEESGDTEAAAPASE